MALDIIDKTNTDAPDGTYPYGKIRDNTGANDGTPVDVEVYGDFHQFFARLMAIAGLVANGIPDNLTNGFQLFEALGAYITDLVTTAVDDEADIRAAADTALQNQVDDLKLDVIQFLIDGGGTAITTGLHGDLEIPFDCVLKGWTITSGDGTSGDIVVDIWVDTYANFPPTIADTITGAEKPTLTGANKNQDLSLSNEEVLTRGEWLRWNVDSISGLTRVTISLRVLRS